MFRASKERREMKWSETCKKCGGLTSSIVLEDDEVVYGWGTIIRLCNCQSSKERTKNGK